MSNINIGGKFVSDYLSSKQKTVSKSKLDQNFFDFLNYVIGLRIDRIDENTYVFELRGIDDIKFVIMQANDYIRKLLSEEYIDYEQISSIANGIKDIYNFFLENYIYGDNLPAVAFIFKKS